MRIVVDGEIVKTEADLHALLDSKLNFGPYYGANLDALWDCLTGGASRPIELIWVNSHESKVNFGAERYEKIVSLLRDVSQRDKKSGRKETFTIKFD
jgi:ribonuclease inhibitor